MLILEGAAINWVRWYERIDRKGYIEANVFWGSIESGDYLADAFKSVKHGIRQGVFSEPKFALEVLMFDPR